MTFEEIYLLRQKNYSKYYDLPKELKELFEESLELIDKTDKRIFASKHEEADKKHKAWLKRTDIIECRPNSNRSSSCYDPEGSIMRALKNGEGDKFGF